MNGFFTTPDGQVVIGQAPNLSIKVAAALGTAALITHGYTKKAVARGAGLAFLTWGVMELGWGANPFRRTLGAAAILLTGSALVRHAVRPNRIR